MENLIELFCAIANTNELAANFILVIAFLKWLHSQTSVTLMFAETTEKGFENEFYITLKRADVNAQNLTNAISSSRYNGGFLPADIRNQVIKFTNPLYTYKR